jgi:hypothetical protein
MRRFLTHLSHIFHISHLPSLTARALWTDQNRSVAPQPKQQSTSNSRRGTDKMCIGKYIVWTERRFDSSTVFLHIGFLCKSPRHHYEHRQTVLFRQVKQSSEGKNCAEYSLLYAEVSAMIELVVFYFYAVIPHTIVTFRIRPGHFRPIKTGRLHHNQLINQPQTFAEWPTIWLNVSDLFELGERVFHWSFSNTFGLLCQLSGHYEHIQTALCQQVKQSSEGKKLRRILAIICRSKCYDRTGRILFLCSDSSHNCHFSHTARALSTDQNRSVAPQPTYQSTSNFRRVTDNMIKCKWFVWTGRTCVSLILF